MFCNYVWKESLKFNGILFANNTDSNLLVKPLVSAPNYFSSSYLKREGVNAAELDVIVGDLIINSVLILILFTPDDRFALNNFFERIVAP